MKMTSPLTTLASISTPDSYHTARDSQASPLNSLAADDTNLSSPVDDEDDPSLLPDEPAYRDASDWLPSPDSAAIHILSGLLSDGTTTPSRHRLPPSQPPKPARVPPPSQIALLATLIIHPSFTTRPQETNSLHTAAHAHTYLRGLLNTVGPINANFRAAFDFYPHPNNHGTTTRATHNSATRTATRAATPDGDNNSPSSPSDNEARLTGSFARSQLLFRRATDFWAVLGWAFRCAAEHPRHWRCWRAWLDLVIGVLEADVDERIARDRVAVEVGKAGKGKEVVYSMLGESLVVGYLEGLRKERRNVMRDVLRAVFAFCDEGTGAGDRAVFREVFEKETAMGVKPKRKREGDRGVVDLENDQFGDYFDGEEEEDDEDEEESQETAKARPSARKKPGRKSKPPTPLFTLTDDLAETIPFRLRIFRLLSAIACYLPSTLATVDELYDRFTDHLRALRLPLFRLFVESHPSILPEDVQVSLLHVVAEKLLPRHPDPADVDPEHCAAGHGLTVPVMRECFLPFAANKVTAEDNAKLSLAVESMLWFVYARAGIGREDAPGLRKAVEAGIRARENKIKRKGPGRLDAGEAAAREALARSAGSLRALVQVVACSEE
ncbi:hypothetical protein C8A05DRAFT_15839 [Staphylotrichum tortipilum]|uniref:Uncharacterized protein n=1 Tax=Staphylotrichum tortipilum TaxID=2831512 RepID=A0AAN6RSR0_9PEZI|nr:hypothetical protein C8A05DRAFT_15839 [Staphylotrichum longicolle]